MKELSIEEKAKAYDEALKVLHKYDGANIMFTQDLKEEMFPELKESDDERIKRVIKQVLSESTTEKDECYLDNGVTQQEVFAWLEKQGKQKPTEEYNITGISSNKSQGKLGEIIKNLKTTWSEKDEVGLANAMWAIEQARTIAKDENDMGNLWYAERWLKSLKDRVQPQPKQEWGEEDTKMFVNIKACLRNANKDYSREVDWLKSIKPQPKNEWSEEDEDYINDLIKHFSQNERLKNTKEDIVIWLKSLKPQKQWKPSKEQMEALWNVYEGGEKQSALASLYNDLKKF